VVSEAWKKKKKGFKEPGFATERPPPRNLEKDRRRKGGIPINRKRNETGKKQEFIRKANRDGET